MKTITSSRSLRKVAITRIAIMLATAFNIQTGHGALHLTTADEGAVVFRSGMIPGGWNETVQYATPVATVERIAEKENQVAIAMAFPWQLADTHDAVCRAALAMFGIEAHEVEVDWNAPAETATIDSIGHDMENLHQLPLSIYPWESTEAKKQAVSMARVLFGITPMDGEESEDGDSLASSWMSAATATMTFRP